MATTISFNGRVTSVPGSYSEVDASGLAVVGLGATGIVACIGEAEGGFPYDADESGFDGYHRISNPGKVGRVFRAGDLREAGNILFDPSKDPGIPGGAQEVVFVKVNPSTASSKTVKDADADDSGLFSSVDYGLFTTQISFDIEDGTTGGKKVTIYANYAGETETFDDLGAEEWFTIAHRETSGATITADLDPTTAFSADYSLDLGIAEPDSYDGTIACIGTNDLWTADFGGPDTVDIESSSPSDTTQFVTVYGIAGGVPATEVIGPLTGTTPVAGATTFTEVYGFTIDAATVGNVIAKEAGGTLVTITAGELIFGAGIEASTSDSDIEVEGVLDLVADAASTDKVLVVGYAAGVPNLEEVTLNGTTKVPTTTDDWDYITHVFTAQLAAARTLTVTGGSWNEGEVARVVSSSTSDTQDIIVFGVDDTGAYAQETVSLNGTTEVTTTTSWNKLYGWKRANIDGATALVGNVSVLGVVGGITVTGGGDDFIEALNGGLGTDKDGRVLAVEQHMGGGQAGGGATIDWNTGGLTATDAGTLVIFGEDEDGAFQAVAIAAGSSGTTSELFTKVEAIAWDHDVTGTTTAALVEWELFNLAVGTYTTIAEVDDFLSAFEGITFTVVTTKATKRGIDDMDESLTVDITSAAEFYGVNFDMAAAISAKSLYVDYVVDAAATKPPINMTGAFLAGGTEGTTAFADWQAALDLLKDLRVNTIVALTEDSAVHAAVVTHCAYMAGAGRSERDAVLGADTAESLSDLKDRAKELNTRHARLCTQDVVRYNSDGEKEQFPPYLGTACVAAGMQAGSEIGTSLTWKYLNVIDVVGEDSTYTWKDDADELIQAGLCVIEPVAGIGYRWGRNVTTHLIDDNIAYVEASTNEAVNFAVYEFRTAMEAAVGEKGFDGTVAAAEGVALAKLGALIAAGAITGYRNLTITLESDVLTVDVEMAPITPVNFVKNTIHLVSASFAAAA